MRHVLFLLALLLPAAPLHAEPQPPSLVDRLMTLLGNKNLPPVKILPPAGAVPAADTAPAPAAAKIITRAGLRISGSFFPVYNLDNSLADDDAPGPAPMTLPFFASGAVTRPQRDVLSLVVMIPDSDRDAARAYGFARAAQTAASAAHPEWYAGHALLFAPQFLNPEDIAEAALPDNGASMLSWASAGWIYGGEAVADAAPGALPATHGMSAYEVLDFVLLAIARKNLFPDLERVVIAGVGAGGDFVQRYAALGQAPDILAGDGVKVRFVAANAWSYLYFDKTRAVPPEAGIYTDPKTESVFAEPKADACAGYNTFPYGLEVMPLYGKKQGDTAIRLRYDSRVVLYLAGKDATHPLPDASPQACALGLQGKTLNERGRIFYQHLFRLYGDTLSQTQRLYEVPEVAEDAAALWASPCGTSALFGDGSCGTPDALKGQ